MPELIILLVIALLITIISINRKDRKDIEAFVLESQGQVQEKLARLIKAEQDYRDALRNADMARALDLGKKYYRYKTDYEYWESAIDPYWDRPNASGDERSKINSNIKISNLRIMRSIAAKNKQALALDIKAMKR
jgi:hypothetical protein